MPDVLTDWAATPGAWLEALICLIVVIAAALAFSMIGD
jgi:hypothetical protein